MQQVGVTDDGFAVFEPAPDGWHFFCEEHKRESVTVYLEEEDE